MSAKKTVSFASAPVMAPSADLGFGGPPSSQPADFGVALPPPPGLFHQKQSPPFRTGGRGSKQLSKAIEHSSAEKSSAGLPQEAEPVWLMHTGKPIYFAKYVSTNCQDPGSVLVQKMQPSHIDPALLVPWEGHLCIEKNERLRRIEMKKEPAGWRILETPVMRQIIADLREQHGCSPSVPTMRAPANKRKYEDWDVVSLESSEFDDASSKASSSVFQMLGSAPATGAGGVTSRAEAIPVRQQMIAATDGQSAGGASRPLTSISPAEDKVAAATASSKHGVEKVIFDHTPVAPLLSAHVRAPGILVGRRESPGQGSVASPVSALLAPPTTIDSADSATSLGRRPPTGNSAALYRTPSPRSCSRPVESLLHTGYSDVPRLDELKPGLARTGISSRYSCSASPPSVSEAGDECSPSSAASHVALTMSGDYACAPDSGDETDTTADASEIGMAGRGGVDSEIDIDIDNNDSTMESKQPSGNSDVRALVALVVPQSEESPVDDDPPAPVADEPVPTRSTSSSDLSHDKNVEANATTAVAGRPPKPTRSTATRGMSRRSARSGAALEAPEEVALPRRRAAARGGDYAKRNSFLGSWPSRKQSAAAGTWNL